MSIHYGLDSLSELADLLPLLLLLLPVILIELGLKIFAIIDIARKKKTKNLSPLIWILIICFVNTIGSIIYLIFGRSDTGVNDGKDDDDI